MRIRSRERTTSSVGSMLLVQASFRSDIHDRSAEAGSDARLSAVWAGGRSDRAHARELAAARVRGLRVGVHAGVSVGRDAGQRVRMGRVVQTRADGALDAQSVDAGVDDGRIDAQAQSRGTG